MKNGMIDTPVVGIHHDVPPETYHSWPALSHSWLKLLRLSPAHLRDILDNGSESPNRTQAFGSAVHCMVLEPDRFNKRFAVRPENQTGTTKAGREFAATSRTNNMTVLSTVEGRWCEAVARRAAANKRLEEWMCRRHEVELSLVWERDGYLCKARPDLLIPGINTLVDLKTTVSASPQGFATQVAKYRYHMQAAWYLDGIERLTGRAWDFWFLAIEKRRPFLVTTHELARGSEAHTAAVAECDALFALYRQCRETDTWPGYGDCFQIELPEWAFDERFAEVPFDEIREE